MSLLLPMLASMAAMASFQIGGALAKDLFPSIGPVGASALRLTLGALMLLAIVRPWRNWPRDASRSARLALAGLGVCVGGVMTFYFLAIERLPLGITIALLFLGPLCVALLGSRRIGDVVWAVLAAIGVVCLVGIDTPTVSLDTIGILYALAAAVSWGGYILCGRIATKAFGASTAALAISIGSLVVLPFGFFEVGGALLQPSLLPLALGVAAFSVALPFSLELYAMARMPPRTFAVFMSIEPLFGVLSGLFILGERLAWVQIAGVATVIVAAAGSAWSSRTGTPAGHPE